MPSAKTKSIDSLSVSDIVRHPLWKFVNDDTDEFLVRPLGRKRPRSLTGVIVGTTVRLANGNSVHALLGNVSTDSIQWNEHFLTLSVDQAGRWFHLARYHDLDWEARGPAALEQALGLHSHDVFPIAYDITAFIAADSVVTKGLIPREPATRLSRAERIALAVQ